MKKFSLSTSQKKTEPQREEAAPLPPTPPIFKKLITRETAEPPPRFPQNMETPDSSVADAIKKLTSSEEQAVAVLANLDDNDVTRLSFLTAIADDFDIDWLKTMIHAEETLTAAIKGLRSNQITEISRQPLTISDNSVMGKVKEKFHL